MMDMKTNEQPLVSCIMPTYNRRPFVEHAIRYFLRQQYDNKELIVIDDGSDCIADLIPDMEQIRYYRLEKKLTLGAKLNLACGYAKGDIIAHWDDDDWYAERRLAYQVEVLLQGGVDVCGINRLLYYDLRNRRAYRYVYPSNQRTWLLGSSLCYGREMWDRNHFADINVGMDGLFVRGTAPERVGVLPDETISVHMIHNDNISPKMIGDVWWHACPVSEIQEIINGDWAVYDGGMAPARPQGKTVETPMETSGTPVEKPVGTAVGTEAEKPVGPPAAMPVAPRATMDLTAGGDAEPFTNIFACLVHERPDCIIDLVRNLHSLDPASIILLYNGGEDKALLQIDFPFSDYGAIVYPDPQPVKHGYLHNFALRCMEFALKRYSFSTLTIVDSDQLCLRPGYTAHLQTFLQSRPDVGLLSSMADRVPPERTKIYTATGAFKEFELWKPFLQRWPGGENVFVHWTFWPSTVFTRPACRDLVKLFKEDAQLQEIMRQTKIWATEEIIFPTLTRLLGYSIAVNPCSYDFVKYKQSFTIQDIGRALQRENAFWVHPVPRKYEDPLRQHIRQRFGQYMVARQVDGGPGSGVLQNEGRPAGIESPEFFRPLRLINEVRNIEGWLEDREADLLIAAAVQACRSLPVRHMVEIGSYHGKSTVLLATVLKTFAPDARLHAIDPHDGMLGASDLGLIKCAPSFEKLKKNITQAGVASFVDVIRQRSSEVPWREPIAFLLIDGLHDYPNVARDFWHFADSLCVGGYAGFHDYADYYPAVKVFVDELISSCKYLRIAQEGSLVIIQKK
jgi:hypothetical protein